jgi:hypothetical protein
MCNFVFIYSLLSDAFNMSDYITSNERMIAKRTLETA